MTKIGSLVAGLIAFLVLLTTTPALAKQSVYQPIPKSFRGTWTVKKGAFSADKKVKLIIGKRSISSGVIHLTNKDLGVKRLKNGFYSFQINHGKPVGENFIIHHTKYHGRPALKVTFDTFNEIYTK